MGSDTPGLGGTAPGASTEPADGSGDHLISAPGRSPVLDAAQLGVLRGYGSERDVAAGDVLFADGDQTYDLIVLLSGTADIVEGYGHPGTSVVASYGPSEFLGEIGMLTGQRAFLGVGALGAASGTGTITYTDGATQQFSLAMADWYNNAPVPGDQIATTTTS